MLLLCTSVFSQTIIHGIVKDASDTIISSSNIQILNSNTNKTVAFGVSDDFGLFAISVKQTGLYILKITYLGYNTLYKKIEINDKTTTIFECVLIENKNQLDELIVKAQSTGMKQKGDKLTYSVENFMNGTEESLKDIIKKLPGLDINSNGKITANGKEIDKLLIDGEEFFRNQHQLATENISSTMVKNVELIKNYKDFGKVITENKSGVTAVNINIKDEFKNKISGSIEASAGYYNIYNLHSSLFSFRKKLKTSLILEDNNTGKQAITLQDYFSLTEDKDNYGIENNSKVVFSKADDFPKFLTSQNNVKERKTNFAAFNLVYSPTPKIKINLSSILNKANQLEEQFIIQDYFTAGTPIQNNELLKNKEISIFSSTQMESYYKPNDKTIFKYLINLNANNTNSNQNTENNTIGFENTINDKTTNKTIYIKNNLVFSRIVNPKMLLNINAFYNKNTNGNEKNIYATNPFLNLTFANNIYEINQNRNIKNSDLGYSAQFSLKLKENTLNILSGSKFENETFLNSVKNQDSFYNNLNIETNDSYFGFDFTYMPKKIFSYSFGLSHHYIMKKYNEISNFNRHYFFPKVDIKAIFNPNHIIDFSYQLSTKFPVIETLLQNRTIIDYRNFNSNENVTYNSEIPLHQFNLNYFIYKSKTTIIINGNYTKQEKSVSTNNINTNNSNQTLFKLSPYEESISGMYFLEKNLTKLYSFTNSLSISKTNKIAFTENIANQYNTISTSFLVQVSSKYKLFPVNFETGYIGSINNYDYEKSNSFLKEKRLFVNFNGKALKNIFWNLNLTYDKQSTATSDSEIYNLNPRVRYNKSKSKWAFSLSGNNIMNIDNPIRIQNNSTANYFEIIRFSSLSGYVLFEVKYKL
ncbi:carboxypeptidase-like regulatory domain-containing protein [Flavobacterium restrictum]|nr:carboxypeptidase-like regulatory domain-containing protein [Flavobacterium restrictum]